MLYVSRQTLAETQSAGASIDTLTLSPGLEATPPTNTHTLNFLHTHVKAPEEVQGYFHTRCYDLNLNVEVAHFNDTQTYLITEEQHRKLTQCVCDDMSRK